jgi:tetratricopeptide (TPR) repeat protein
MEEALALYRKGNLTAALLKYQQILQADPKSPDAYAGLTRVYLKQRNVAQASETVNKGLSLSNSPRLRVALGEVYFRQGKINEAEQEWVAVIKSGTPDARAYFGLARVRDAISMYQKGKAMIDKAHELDPADPDIEKIWVGTLRSAERIKYLEAYVADPNDEDRAAIQRYLDYLKARAKQPKSRCRLVGKVESTETPLVRLLYDPEHLRGYGLSVKVNDHKADLMLDTGASGILIDRYVAEKAGVTKLSDTRIGGIGDRGDKSGYIGLAKSIKIGDLEFQNCPVEVLDKRSVVGESGLIGADVFEDFLVDIDFPKEKLRLSQLPKRPGDNAEAASLRTDEDEDDDYSGSSSDAPATTPGEKPPAAAVSRFHDAYIAPEMKSYTRIYRFGHELLAPTKIGDAPIKLFLIDTGALNNNITPAAAREVTKVHGDEYTTVEGVSGMVKNVYSANKAVIQFSRVRQENQDMLSINLDGLSDGAGTEISGILGFVMLRFLDLKIDYRDGLIDCTYDPKFWGLR